MQRVTLTACLFLDEKVCLCRKLTVVGSFSMHHTAKRYYCSNHTTSLNCVRLCRLQKHHFVSCHDIMSDRMLLSSTRTDIWIRLTAVAKGRKAPNFGVGSIWHRRPLHCRCTVDTVKFMCCTVESTAIRTEDSAALQHVIYDVHRNGIWRELV